VALSLRLPSPGVTRHRFSAEPGLSSPATLSSKRGGDYPANWQRSHKSTCNPAPAPHLCGHERNHHECHNHRRRARQAD
jgi:hypothetical protein